VVTGQRAALASAQNIKRLAPQVVDSIVAQDIGKFPDNAVSDSLQRITGVQVFRDSGETNRVVIRGLPNVVTTLNGREIFTGSGRGFAFQDLPAEAVSELNVYKTSSADLIEGGIAGLVNINLHKPFDFKGFSLA
jgi:TonB-dependent receptor